MDSSIAQIVRELESQLAPMAAEETQARETLAQLKDRRHKIEAALAALGGGARKAKPPKSGRTCATKREVVELVRDFLRASGPIPHAALQTLVKDRLTEDGQRSLSGFRLRFNEALREPEFGVSPEGLVTLAGQPSIHGTGKNGEVTTVRP